MDWEKYDKIAFVSKSVGTVAAGFLTRRLAETGGCVQIVNLFLTPIEPTFKYLTEAKTAQKWVRPRSSFPAQRISGWSRNCWQIFAGSMESSITLMQEEIIRSKQGMCCGDVEIAKEIVGFYEKLL